MDAQAYADGSMYEIFICRAHRKQRHEVTKADGAYMKNLINTEKGQNLQRLTGSYEKQLEAVKKAMDKALDKYLKFKLTSEERQTLEELKSRLEWAPNSGALMSIVNEGINATQRFKDYNHLR